MPAYLSRVSCGTQAGDGIAIAMSNYVPVERFDYDQATLYSKTRATSARVVCEQDGQCTTSMCTKHKYAGQLSLSTPAAISGRQEVLITWLVSIRITIGQLNHNPISTGLYPNGTNHTSSQITHGCWDLR